MKKTFLTLIASLVSGAFASDPVDPSLYEGFTIEQQQSFSGYEDPCGEYRDPNPEIGDLGCGQYGGSRILYKNVATIDGSSLNSIVVKEEFTVDEVVINRSFANGKKATWIMPFDVNGWPTGVGLFDYTQVGKDADGVWFVSIMSGKPPYLANTPYFVFPQSDVSSLTFTDVTFKATESNCVEEKNPAYGDKNLNFVFSFCGTYDYIEWNDAKEAGKIYGFAAGDGTGVTVGQFSRGAAGAKIRPMRAYLKYMGRYSLDEAPALQKSSAGKVAVLDDSDDVDLPTTIEVRIIEKESSTQGVRIGTMDTRTGEVTLDKWVDLRGRSLNRKPDAQGTYYNNGKKVIIK